MMMRARTPCSVLRTMGGAWRHMDLSPFTISAPFPSSTSPSLSNALPAYLSPENKSQEKLWTKWP